MSEQQTHLNKKTVYSSVLTIQGEPCGLKPRKFKQIRERIDLFKPTKQAAFCDLIWKPF